MSTRGLVDDRAAEVEGRNVVMRTGERRSAFGGPRVDVNAVGSLKTLLDYASAEGSELGLPVFVGLPRIASLDLNNSVARPPAPIRQNQYFHQAKRALS